MWLVAVGWLLLIPLGVWLLGVQHGRRTAAGTVGALRRRLTDAETRATAATEVAAREHTTANQCRTYATDAMRQLDAWKAEHGRPGRVIAAMAPRPPLPAPSDAVVDGCLTDIYRHLETAREG